MPSLGRSQAILTHSPAIRTLATWFWPMAASSSSIFFHLLPLTISVQTFNSPSSLQSHLSPPLPNHGL